MELKLVNNNDLIISLTDLLEFISPFLDKPQCAHIKECLYHGEESIAFEDMCSYIDDNDITISEQIFNIIETTGKSMEIDPTTWLLLKNNVL